MTDWAGEPGGGIAEAVENGGSASECSALKAPKAPEPATSAFQAGHLSHGAEGSDAGTAGLDASRARELGTAVVSFFLL